MHTLKSAFHFLLISLPICFIYLHSLCCPHILLPSSRFLLPIWLLEIYVETLGDKKDGFHPSKVHILSRSFCIMIFHVFSTFISINTNCAHLSDCYIPLIISLIGKDHFGKCLEYYDCNSCGVTWSEVWESEKCSCLTVCLWIYK